MQKRLQNQNPKSLAERFKGRNSSALIELARSRNSYLSKASCKQSKQKIRGCTDTSWQQLASFQQLTDTARPIDP